MPTEREAVINKALSGLELKELILRDFNKLLDQEGMLSQYTAYGRASYIIHLKIQTDNAMNRVSESFIHSKPEARQRIEEQPGLAAVEGAPPLRDSSFDSAAGSLELTRNITSPNAERLNAGLPITVDTRDLDGSKAQKPVTYPIPEPGEVAEDVTLRDTTAQTRKDWDMAPLPTPVSTVEEPAAPIRPEGPQPLTPVTPVPGTAPKKDA